MDGLHYYRARNVAARLFSCCVRGTSHGSMIYAIYAGKGQTSKYYRIENVVYLLQFYYKVSRLMELYYWKKGRSTRGCVQSLRRRSFGGKYIINFFKGQREPSLGMRTHLRMNLYYRSWEVKP